MVVAEGPFVLGNTRLAVQDPTPSANQPFCDPDGRFTVVFNGEIYNHRELVRQHGLNMRTRCDGEVIPLLWAKLGPQCLRLFRGMYGIAVADHDKRRLYLARDRFGIKPLHWRRYKAGVLFASDPAPLWRVDRALPLDRRALADYFHFGAVASGRSPHDGIEAVAPGACISIGEDGLVRPELVVPAIGPGSGPETIATSDERSLAGAFRSSVRLHLSADVPTALLLSAGVDSTLLALAARDEGQSLHCVTVSAPWGEDESHQAKATAVEYGHTHETVAAEIDEAAVDSFLSVMPRPTIDGLNSFLVNRAVRAGGYKVALSGLGADEALGGYGYLRIARILPLLHLADRVPGIATPLLALASRRRPAGTGSGKFERLLGAGGPRSLEGLVQLQRELFVGDRVRSMLGVSAEIEDETTVSGRGPAAVAEAEMIRYLQPMLLPDADAFSMAASVELRVPFVDGPFFTAALGRRHLRGKAELVHQMGDRYLELLSRRRKTGFSVPMQEWIRSGPLRHVVADAARPDAPIWDHLEAAVGRPILAAAGENSRWSEVWALAALDGWLRRR
ncbi:asparagine synthetase B [Iamia sp.]|uniref:asparagine synthetase B family protein n=1 Tax=Iamia sp. TaxID=2722710 RepID=UPI002D7E6322|nr:asparagine synthetase B [Iamia sp.]